MSTAALQKSSGKLPSALRLPCRLQLISHLPDQNTFPSVAKLVLCFSTSKSYTPRSTNFASPLVTLTWFDGATLRQRLRPAGPHSFSLPCATRLEPPTHSATVPECVSAQQRRSSLHCSRFTRIWRNTNSRLETSILFNIQSCGIARAERLRLVNYSASIPTCRRLTEGFARAIF